MPYSACSVCAPAISRSAARQPMPIAEIEISATCAIAASASALPWPKRWSRSAGMAATRTANRVTSEATRSSPVSASEPSIATEPVAQAA